MTFPAMKNNMNNTLKLLFLGLALIISIGGCANMTIASQYDPKYDFSTLKTYAWIRDPDVNIDSQLEVKRLKTAIDKKMAKLGYRQSDDPDFKIALHILTGDAADLVDWGYGYGWQGAYGYGFSAYQPEQGSMLVDIVDVTSNELVWQGLARADVKNEDSEIRGRTINSALNKLFKDFPPKNK